MAPAAKARVTGEMGMGPGGMEPGLGETGPGLGGTGPGPGGTGPGPGGTVAGGGPSASGPRGAGLVAEKMKDSPKRYYSQMLNSLDMSGVRDQATGTFAV